MFVLYKSRNDFSVLKNDFHHCTKDIVFVILVVLQCLLDIFDTIWFKFQQNTPCLGIILFAESIDHVVFCRVISNKIVVKLFFDTSGRLCVSLVGILMINKVQKRILGASSAEGVFLSILFQEGFWSRLCSKKRVYMGVNPSYKECSKKSPSAEFVPRLRFWTLFII